MARKKSGRSVSGRNGNTPNSPLTPSMPSLARVLGINHYGVAKQIPASASAHDFEEEDRKGKMLKNHQLVDERTPSKIFCYYAQVEYDERQGSKSKVRLREDELPNVWLYINTKKGAGLPEFRINGALVASMGHGREGHFLPLRSDVVSTRENPITTAVLVNKKIVSLLRVFIDPLEDGWYECCVECTAITSSQELPKLPRGEARTA